MVGYVGFSQHQAPMNRLEFLTQMMEMVPDEIWKEWEDEADRLELPLDYYIMEFV